MLNQHSAWYIGTVGATVPAAALAPPNKNEPAMQYIKSADTPATIC